MNLKILSFVIILILSLNNKGNAQNLKHYISYNTIPYSNFFNKESDKLMILTMLSYPSINYKIEKEKYAIEAFFASHYSFYHRLNYDEIPKPDSSILSISNYKIGLTFNYLAVDKKRIKVSPQIGVVYDMYKAFRIVGWRVFNNPTWYEPQVYYDNESTLGALLGLNANVPIWKNFYLNNNIRYSIFPTAKHNKQNFIWEIGIGFNFSTN